MCIVRTTTALLASTSLTLIAACGGDAPLPATSQEAVPPPALASSHGSGNPLLQQQLAELSRFSAPYHDLTRAQADYPVLVNIPGLTSPDGCVSDASAGGMGYHYAGHFGLDDQVNYLEPELLVFAPTNGAAVAPDGTPRMRLAGFDYFIPYSNAWPEGGAAPTSAEMGLALDPPVAFAPSRFGGWMFHIWLWANNPAGMFANWNPAVPLCADSPF